MSDRQDYSIISAGVKLQVRESKYAPSIYEICT